MTDTYKILGQALTGDLAADNLTAKETIVYEVPGNTQASISAIEITNTDMSNQNYSLSFVKNSEKDNSIDINYNDSYSAGIFLESLGVLDKVAPDNVSVNFVVYGNGKYVGLGESYFAYSLDGITWQQGATRTVNGITYTFDDIFFVNNMFMVSGYGYQYSTGQYLYNVGYSTDGINWNWAGTDKEILKIVYANGVYVGYNNTYLGYSTNAVDWTWVDTGKSTMSLVFGNGKFIYSNSWGELFESFDGINWSQYSGGRYLDSMFYANGKYIASYGNQLYYSQDALTWTHVESLPNSLRSISYGNGKFVIICMQTTHALYSINGIDWIQTPLGIEKYSVAYGSDKFVCVGYYGIAYSYDGIKWFSNKLSNNFNNSYAYGNNKYVAVSYYGIAYSEDLSTWEFADVKTGCSSIAYGNGIFTGVTPTGACMYSLNGIDWVYDIGAPLRKPVYGNGVYVSVSNSTNLLRYSTDGFNWTDIPVGVDIRAIAFGNGIFVGVGIWNSIYSTDGINWSSPISVGSYFYNITFGDGKFVATSAFGGSAIYSTNGQTWYVTYIPDYIYADIAYGNGKFVSPVANTNVIITSTDAITWDMYYSPQGYSNIKFINNKFYMWGSPAWSTSTSLYESVDGYSINLVDSNSTYYLEYANGVFIKTSINDPGQYVAFYSTDGYNWSPITSIKKYNESNAQVFYVNSQFVVSLGSSILKTFRSADGVNWSQKFFGYNYQGVSYQNEKFFAYEPYGTHGAISTDGFNWTEIDIPQIGRVLAGNNKFIAFAYNIAYVSNDAVSWTAYSVPINYIYGNMIYYRNKFIIMDNKPDYSGLRVLSSEDGTTWTTLYNSLNMNQRVMINNDDLLFVAGDASSIVYTYDLENWSVANNISSDILNPSFNIPQVETILSSLAKSYVIYNKSISSGQTHEIKGGITLSAGDQVRVRSNSAEIITNVYGVEIA